MKRLIIALALSAAFVTPSLSESSRFYEKMVGKNTTDKGGWLVSGNTGDSDENAGCGMLTDWNDGSYFVLIKDLIDSDLYIRIKNNQWNISDKPGIYKLRMNFKYSNGAVKGEDTEYVLGTKNSIAIPDISKKRIEYLYDAIELQLVMPGTIQNMSIPLNNTREAMKYLSDCIKKSEGYNLNKAR